MAGYKDIFISYGRRESLGLVARLHQKLKLAGYEVWFDKVNIPDGEDYAIQIMYGIESAHNFIYVMSPHALCSPYCLMELEYARLLGKRIIPINQIVISRTDPYTISLVDQQTLRQFYLSNGLDDPHIQTTQQILEQSLKLIGRTDWLDAKEILSEEDCEKLTIWAKFYENHWSKHEDVHYLKTLKLPEFGEAVDSLETIFERLLLVLNRHQEYVKKHTYFLSQALIWIANHCSSQYLLIGKERETAEHWLVDEFKEAEQLPCTPPFFLCEFICESKRNALNLFSDVFLCYAAQDVSWSRQISEALYRKALTVWRRDKDLQGGMSSVKETQIGMVQANTILFLISSFSLKDVKCLQELQFAINYGKRIIPVFCENISPSELPPYLESLQSIEYNRNFSKIADKLLASLNIDYDYFYKYTIFLSAALKWQEQNKNQGLLLRGFNLKNAELWLENGQQRSDYKPLPLHYVFIEASLVNKGQDHAEIFISYSRKDSGFARRLNTTLQSYGKITWFDQENIAEGTDFHKEIYKGIENADNFVFILSPDALDSEYCADEVSYAASLNKRIIPILYRDVSSSNIPSPLSAVQWSNFKIEEKEFDVAFRQLLITLETDREYVEEHTRWLQRAILWDKNRAHRDFLLSVSEYEQAEEWFENAQTKNPKPTQLQRSLIQRSEKHLLFKARASKVKFGIFNNLLIILVLISQFTFNEIISLREALLREQFWLARVIGDSTSTLLTSLDKERTTKVLLGLESEAHVTASVVYDKDGKVFASYSRIDIGKFEIPPVKKPSKEFTFKNLNIFEDVFLNNKKIGTVFIQSDFSIIYDVLKKNFVGLILIFIVALLIFAYLKSEGRLRRLALLDSEERKNKPYKPKLSSYYNREPLHTIVTHQLKELFKLFMLLVLFMLLAFVILIIYFVMI